MKTKLLLLLALLLLTGTAHPADGTLTDMLLRRAFVDITDEFYDEGYKAGLKAGQAAGCTAPAKPAPAPAYDFSGLEDLLEQPIPPAPAKPAPAPRRFDHLLKDKTQ